MEQLYTVKICNKEKWSLFGSEKLINNKNSILDDSPGSYGPNKGRNLGRNGKATQLESKCSLC